MFEKLQKMSVTGTNPRPLEDYPKNSCDLSHLLKTNYDKISYTYLRDLCKFPELKNKEREGFYFHSVFACLFFSWFLNS